MGDVRKRGESWIDGGVKVMERLLIALCLLAILGWQTSVHGQVGLHNVSTNLKTQIPSAEVLRSDFLVPLMESPKGIEWLDDVLLSLQGGSAPKIPEHFMPIVEASLKVNLGALEKVEAAIEACCNPPSSILSAEGIVEIPSLLSPISWRPNANLIWHIRLGALYHLQNQEIDEVVRYLQLGYRLNQIEISSIFNGDRILGYIEVQIQLFAIHCAAYPLMTPSHQDRLRFVSLLPLDGTFLQVAASEELRLQEIFERANGGDSDHLKRLELGKLATNRLYESCSDWTEEMTGRQLSVNLTKLRSTPNGKDIPVYNTVYLALFRQIGRAHV